MSKGNDKKAKAGKIKPKAVASSYKQAQGKAAPIPFAKRIGAQVSSSSKLVPGSEARAGRCRSCPQHPQDQEKR